jgi:hypothetical protein
MFPRYQPKATSVVLIVDDPSGVTRFAGGAAALTRPGEGGTSP